MEIIGETVRRILEGYLAPRTSVRRLIDGGHGLSVAILLLVLGYIVSYLLLGLVPNAIPDESPRVARHVAGLINQGVVFFVLCTLIYWFGRISGGTGTWPETLVAVAWHTVVTSPLTPFPAAMLMALGSVPGTDGAAPAAPVEIGASTLLAALVAMMAWFWLLAQYVAELHRFRNVWGVLGVLVGVPVAVSMVALSVLGSVAVQQ